MVKSISIAKIGEDTVNEDAVLAKDNCIAVSDGAGGGGVFADKWSEYLLNKLPEHPILSGKELDEWLSCIWEPFYNWCEVKAKEQDGMFLNKFYDEGSFATLAAAWKIDDHHVKWCTYGDSTVFCYHKSNKLLECSATDLADYNNPPSLINSKDELIFDNFKGGEFITEDGDIVFVCSDALSHYILMMYKIANINRYRAELERCVCLQTKNSNHIQIARNCNFLFEDDVLFKLLRCMNNKANMTRHLSKLQNKNLLSIDDHSIVIGF